MARMASDDRALIRELIDRLGRISAAEEWSETLNPAQRAALGYLARANRFSRAPSQVADFLCTTRGTASQTLKALERKALIVAVASANDKRSIRYDVTESGRAALESEDAVDAAIAALSDAEAGALRVGLERVARAALARRGRRPFGLCRACRHHQERGAAAHCALLDEALQPFERDQLCHEHSAP